MTLFIRKFIRILKRIFYVLDTHLLWRLPPHLRNRLWQRCQRVYRLLQSRNKALPSSSYFSGKQTFPPSVLNELRKIGNSIEPNLHPEGPNFPIFEKLITFARPHAGHQYAHVISELHPPYTHCFILPWIQRGGGDLVALHHIQAAVQSTGSKVLVILTEPGDSPWASRVPPHVQVLNLALYLDSLSSQEAQTVLLRLLLQVAPQRIHVIYSELGWEALSQYGQALRQQSRLYVSLFCGGKTRSGGPIGEAYQFFPRCAPYIDRVFSDNVTFPQKLQELYGFPSPLFKTLYSPIKIYDKLKFYSPPLKPTVLWASRMDQPKRPDLLAQIAKQLPEVTFLIFGVPIFKHEGGALHLLKRLKNVHLKGVYDSFSSLPTKDCSLFLYTSEWDGLPNVLLEAAAAGLPIVASDVGGVKEFITSETGYLVSPFDDVDQYVKTIQHVLKNPDEAKHKTQKALKLLQERHTWEGFVKDYIESES